jgi:hypothetical protein
LFDERRKPGNGDKLACPQSQRTPEIGGFEHFVDHVQAYRQQFLRAFHEPQAGIGQLCVPMIQVDKRPIEHHLQFSNALGNSRLRCVQLFCGGLKTSELASPVDSFELLEGRLRHDLGL